MWLGVLRSGTIVYNELTPAIEKRVELLVVLVTKVVSRS